MIGVLAALTAGVAGLLLGRSRRIQLSPARPSAPVLIALVAVSGALAVVVLLSGRRVVLGLVGVACGAAVVGELRRRRRDALTAARAARVLGMCEALAAELAAGRPPAMALDAAAQDWPDLLPVASAAHLGSDVPEAFRELAVLPGCSQLRAVAAAWQVAHRSGAGLAAALGATAEQLRQERVTAGIVATELAAAHATARLLAALPLGVLLLGSGLGGDPVAFLLDTTPGLVCLCAGLGLGYLGLRWLSWIGARVLRT